MGTVPQKKSLTKVLGPEGRIIGHSFGMFWHYFAFPWVGVCNVRRELILLT